MFCFFDVRFLDYTSPFNQVVLILGVSQLRSYYRPLVCNDSHLLRPRLSTREAALSIPWRIPLLPLMLFTHISVGPSARCCGNLPAGEHLRQHRQARVGSGKEDHLDTALAAV